MANVREAGKSAPSVPLTTVACPRKTIQGTPLRQAHLLSSYDAIVIGSGIGGLSAAVALSKFGGQKVLVLEQHYTAGGLTQAFQRGNKYAWNVGVHYVGGGIGRCGGDAYPAFNALTGGKVSWAKLPAAYDRIVIGHRSYDFVQGEEAWLQNMMKHFPAERKALEQILKLADEAWNAYRLNLASKVLPGWLSGLTDNWTVKPWLQLAGQTTAEMLAGLTQDSELQAVLAGEYADIGPPPADSSAGYQLVLLKHYLQGAYAPTGGASQIAAAMTPIIEAAGGAVVTSADVSEVLVASDNSRVTGVKLATEQEISSNTVISGAGVLNTYGHLLPAPVLASNPALQQQLDMANALNSTHHYGEHCVLYCALEEQPVPEFNNIGCIHKHLSSDLQGNAVKPSQDLDGSCSYVFFSCCDGREQVVGAAAFSVDGAAASSGGKPLSTLQVVTPAPYEWFESWAGSKWHNRGQAYKDFKQMMTEKLLGALGAMFPDLPRRIKFCELATPLSTEHFTRWNRGGSYGLPMTPERFKANNGRGFGPLTPLKGLYLTGQDVTGDGVVAAMMSGVFSAIAAGGVRVALGYGREVRKWI